MHLYKLLPALHLTVILTVTIPVSGQVLNGALDASDLHNKHNITLNGNWQFYPDQFLFYEDFKNYPSRSSIQLEIPATWNSQGLSGFGYGTYRLIVRNLPQEQLLGLSIPNVYSSYSLYVDDKLLAKNGVVGTDKAFTVPQWLMKTVAFKPDDADAEIIIHVANFHHNRGGIHKPITLGNYEELQKLRESEMLAQMVPVAGLIVLAIFCFAIFFISFKTKPQHVIIFAFLCLAWAGRTFFAHIYLRAFFFPDMNWLVHIRLEYIFLYLSLILGNIFVLKAFALPRGLAISSMLMVNILLILITLALPPQVFTALLPAYLIFAIVNILYIVYSIGNAIIKERPAAWYAGVGILLALSIFCYEILSYQFEWTLNHLVLQGSYLLVFLVNSFILAHNFSRQERKIEELEEQRQRLFKTVV